MTENKRFTIKRKDLKYAKILENGKDLTGYFFIAQAEFICDKWNELSDENEELKQKLKEHETALKEQSNSIYQLKKKNELKESIDRIDSLIHTQEDYLAWSIIYETLTDGKPLSYRLRM